MALHLSGKGFVSIHIKKQKLDKSVFCLNYFRCGQLVLGKHSIASTVLLARFRNLTAHT